MVEDNFRQPCKSAIWHILPQIRAGLTRELATQGLSQQEIAEELGLTQAAVSQYISKRRIKQEILDEMARRLLENSAKDIKEDNSIDLPKRIFGICNFIHANRTSKES